MRFCETSTAWDLTYSDVFLVPSRSSIRSRLDVCLAPQDGTAASIPIVSANMNSVTGPRLAATLARRGGLGVLPQDMAAETMNAAVRWVKSQPVEFDSAINLAAGDTVADALALVLPMGGYGVVVRGNGGSFLGSVPAELLAGADAGTRLGDLIDTSSPVLEAEQFASARDAFDLMTREGIVFAPILHEGVAVGTLSSTGALRSTLYSPAVDRDGRLVVAAAIGINGSAASRARELADAGADVIVIDTAHGHQDAMLRTLAAVADLGLGLPIVAGNVVTATAVGELVDAGATVVKVGVGPGAMCTTRMMTAVGRPQFSAVLETAAEARSRGAHVWADGGVRYPRDVALALAAGAASVMIGSWFAGTIEAPGKIARDDSGRPYKESWGMASTKAVRERFDRLDAYELARKTLFAEGISSSKIYLDPLRPSVEDLLDMITAGLRSSLSYAGATTLEEFHERAVVGVQSAAGYEEGKALPVSW